MRKECHKQMRAEWARPLRDNEVTLARRGGILVTDAAMEEFKAPMFRIHAIEELQTDLDVMAAEIQRLSGSLMTSAEEVRILESFLEGLRLDAHEAVNSSEYREGTSPEMGVRNRELENMVRILRNELDHIMMRTCS